MKVRCIKLIDSNGNPIEGSNWLTIAEIYNVLSIIQDVHGRWLLRLIADKHPRVALFPLTQFEILSAKVPQTWIVTWKDSGLFELTPEAWSRPGFWEDFYDAKLEAAKAFEDEARKIIECDP